MRRRLLIGICVLLMPLAPARADVPVIDGASIAQLVKQVQQAAQQIQLLQQQVQQVILNLVHNARHALNQKFPEGGTGKIMEIRLASHQAEGRTWLRLSVVDHGCGIPAELLEQVCEPFFTTKPAGVGTGLGLSISRGIVTDHGGRLTIESEEGAFTRVHIDLPAAQGG